MFVMAVDHETHGYVFLHNPSPISIFNRRWHYSTRQIFSVMQENVHRSVTGMKPDATHRVCWPATVLVENIAQGAGRIRSLVDMYVELIVLVLIQL